MVNARKILQKFWFIFREFLQDVTLLLSVFVLIYLFLFRPHQVNGMSMYPNFHDKEFLLSERISYRFRQPKRAEIVIFRAPPTEICAAIECEYIKRVVGLPGETVAIKNNAVHIDGQKLQEDYLPQGTKTMPGEFLQAGAVEKIPSDHYLLLGDNRSGSRDGRDFGFIKKEDVVGRVILRYWPADRFGLVEHPTGTYESVSPQSFLYKKSN